MSPIVIQAKERLESYLEHTTTERRTDPLLRRLIDDLIAAVRGEQPTDNPF